MRKDIISTSIKLSIVILTPNSKFAFILDDTVDIRTGCRIENISFVHEHVGGKGKKESK